MDVDKATDDQLIEAARRAEPAQAGIYLDTLYRRYYTKVAGWCLRISGNPDEAADLAQEVFARVHTHLDTFRMASRFSTWLYTVVRSVAINRGVSRRRQEAGRVDVENSPEPQDPRPGPGSQAERNQQLERLRAVMQSRLDPTEAQVVYLHFVDGMTLPSITRLLELDNKSGAKAYVVSGMRKLRRNLRGDSEAGLRPVENE